MRKNAAKFQVRSGLLALAVLVSLVFNAHLHAGTVGTNRPSKLERQTLKGHVPEVVEKLKLKPVDRVSSSKRIQLAIGLPLRNKPVLNSVLQQIYDPASPNYRRYLTPEEFAEMFGPAERDYQTLIAFAETHGFTVTTRHPNRMILDVEGTVGDIEKALHVTMKVYQHPKEARTFYAPDVEPSVDLAVPILDISGLSDYDRPHPHHVVKQADLEAKGTMDGGSGPSGAYMGYDFRAAYVPGTSLTGSGQMVGLVQFDGYYANDIAAYLAETGLPSVPLTNVLLNGFSGTPGGNNLEVALDIEMAICMAPGLSRIIVYEGNPNNFIPNDVLNRIATDNLAKQISCSWGWIGGPKVTTDQIFQQMAAQGQAFFTASGDSNAYSSTSPSGDVDSSVAYGTPAANPYVTSVGGTILTTTGPGGSYVSEEVWRRSAQIGTGGGFSTNYPIPYWQQGVSMSANKGSTTGRNFPDVALVAEDVYVIAKNGGRYTVGGTSCAAPLWAGFTALVNQQSVAQGQPVVGFINPALYTIGMRPDYANYFHDTTVGNNYGWYSITNYDAVAGYDLCTGWGTPSGTNLIQALIGTPANLMVLPAGGLIASGPQGGPLCTASQKNYTLINTVGQTVNWSASKTADWVTLSATNGMLAAGSNTTVTVTINATANSLADGSYTDTVSFVNLTTGYGTTNRTVILTVTETPATPSSLTATALSTNQIKLSWVDNSCNETGFKIERAPDSAGSPGTWAQVYTVGANVTNQTDTGLSLNTKYWYRVRAYNASANSGYSDQATAATLPLPPPASLNLTAVVLPMRQIKLSWTGSVSNHDGFRIERSTDGVNFTQIAQIAPNVTNYRDTTVLWPGTTYYYRVCAYNTGGNSGYSNPAGATTPVLSGVRVSAWGVGYYFPPDGLTNVVAIARGCWNGLALKSDGTVLVWGDNQQGALNMPPGLNNVVAITAGVVHNLALKSDGTVVGWDAKYRGNNYGQAIPPPWLNNVVAIDAGYYHSLALRNDGTVVGWGFNWFGEATPPAGLSNVVAVSGGYHYSLALKSDGTVVGWGNPNWGTTTPPAGLSNVVAIVAGTFHAVALKSDGTVVTWGTDYYGGLLTPPAGLNKVVAIGAHDVYSLALRSDGTVVAWGNDDHFGTVSPASSASNVVAIATLQQAAITLMLTPPKASFTASPTAGATPLAVTFTDTSTGTIANRFWDFGDGTTTNTTATTLTHVYNVPGKHTVTLTVSSSAGTSTTTGSDYIWVRTGFENWQLQYFGCTDCPQAGIAADADGDGQNNEFEYVAGLNPTNSASVFRLSIENVAGQPGQKRLIFSPRWTDRVYTPMFCTNLPSGAWEPLAGVSQSDNGTERTVTDLNATESNKFYRIQITLP